MPCPWRSGGTAATALCLAMTLGLGGCGGGETVGEALGFEQSGPDEMNVIKRPPLTVPPDYNLRPPRPNEPRSEAEAASDAARETLLGPSSSAAPETSGATNAAEEAKATLIGISRQAGADTGEDGQRYDKSPPIPSGGEQVARAETGAASSAGQSALLSRTDRVERNLDALDETRDENRVDGALLRRLIAWEPAEDASAQDADGDGKPDAVVQVVRREQKPVSVTMTSE